MPDSQATLADWLDHIAQTHSAEIEMGLGRVRQVWARMCEGRSTGSWLANRTVIIAGTNGKGTTAFALAQLLMDQGFKVGVYSSPHLLHYNERVQVNARPLEDHALVEAFECVEQHRETIPLTYFEFGTLAAFAALSERQLDVAILEVGLGGRLDAVNIIDADLAIITSVGLDHTDWLGEDLNQIAREKAGVLRQGQHVLLGEGLPAVVDEMTHALDCHALTVGKECGFRSGRLWLRRACDAPSDERFELDLPESYLPPNNVCLASQAYLELLAQLKADCLSESAVPLVDQIAALERLRVPGRMELLHSRPDVFVDVCHNPHAGMYLASLLERMRPGYTRVVGVFSALEDKDISGLVQALQEQVDQWYIAPLQVPRAADLKRLETEVGNHTKDVLSFACLDEALGAAVKGSTRDTLLIVFGSFYVVEAAKVYFATGALSRKHTQNEK